MKKKEVDQAQELAESMSRYVNGMGNDVKNVVQHLSNEHRTLQQGITKLCVAWLEECGRKQKVGDFDLRNQASVELGQKFVERLKPEERYMPLI